MWGEHGKGFRSEYGPEFFGEELFTELRRVKAAFDPHNKMNPGKICTPLNSDAELVKVTDTKRGYFFPTVTVRLTFRCVIASSRQWSVTGTAYVLTTTRARRCALR